MCHASSGRSTYWRALTLLTAPVLAIAILACPVTSWASNRPAIRFSMPCNAQNQTTATHYYGTGANLQIAINSANSGDILEVRGTCIGNFTIANTTLSLVGFGSLMQPEAMLNGNSSGTVVSIVDAVVTLTDLLITGGRSESQLVTDSGGGINNIGVLTLNGNTQVTGNASVSGGGIASDGSVTLNGSAQVDYNKDSYGGGIYHTEGQV